MMNKFIIIIITLIGAFNNGLGQYGSIVREDRIWNYRYDHFPDLYGEPSWTEEHPGYHFDGTVELDGVAYAVFRDGDGNEVDYLRQDGDKVYVYVGNKCYDSSELFSEEIHELMLYDFGAQEGESYLSPGYCNDGWCGDSSGFLISKVGISRNFMSEYKKQIIRGQIWDVWGGGVV